MLKLSLFYWLPVVIYAAFIYYFSSLSALPDLGGNYSDKVIHIIEYFLLGALLLRAIRKTSPQARLSTCLFFTVSICFLYGVSDEVHQLFVPTRELSVLDIFADIAGGGLGAFIYKVRFTPLEMTAKT